MVYINTDGSTRIYVLILKVGKAKNKEVIGRSESYSSKSSMKKGIASVMRNAPGSRVVEVE